MPVLPGVFDLPTLNCRLKSSRLGYQPILSRVYQVNLIIYRYLNLISRVVPHFTLYLTETNQTHVPNDIHIINKILNPLGLVITEDIFSSELNPKNATP